MKKKMLSLRAQYVVTYFIGGLCWLAAAITGLFDTERFDLAASVLELIAVLCTLVTIVPHAERDDEMSLEHIRRAKSRMFDFTQAAMIFISVVLLIGRSSADYRNIYRFIIAGMQLLAGFMFFALEQEG